MADTPDHITITVDEDALRKQIQGIIGEELRAASFGLRRAADTLDPNWMVEHSDWLEAELRKKWEAERAATEKKGGTHE